MSQLEHLVGRVKWFNNKTGYGFITITDGSRSGSDIFVHHSAILVDSQQYKYLVQGEYIEFDLVRTESATHEWQASNVVGIKGGKLMCETRHELKLARSEYKSTRQPEENVVQSQAPRQRTPKQRKPDSVRARGEGPRESVEEQKDWTVVSRKSSQAPRSRQPRKSSAVTSSK